MPSSSTPSNPPSVAHNAGALRYHFSAATLLWVLRVKGYLTHRLARIFIPAINDLATFLAPAFVQPGQRQSLAPSADTSPFGPLIAAAPKASSPSPTEALQF
ncbi:hypothetical protein NUW54_g6269 [Trametes sanguinea]|uniref:Uncharacterized protein n=1 Tax=Trametes sanguinea TaxID=158606 RepID=A0ACC1PW29_9APHY|nr:hypothetical protein NUW54_g6269 [Trametes sanguinea]